MIDLDKAIYSVDEQIIKLEEEKKLIKNFNNLDLIEKIDLIKKTNLRLQREEVAKNLINSFKSEIIRKKGTGEIAVNHFIVKIEGVKIYIPIYLNNIIYMGYFMDEIRKEKIKDIKPKQEELLDLEEEINSLLFFQFKKRKELDLKIKRVRNEIEYIKNRNLRITERNKKRDINIKNIKKILLEIKEDIEFFEEHGYKFCYSIDSIRSNSLI